MERIDRPPSARLKIANIRNKFSLLLAGRVGLAYHRFIGSSVHRFIGSSVSGPSLRPDADSGTYRLNYPYILTPGLRPTIARGLTDNPIPDSASYGLTRSSPIPVTRDVAVTGSGSDVTTSHFITIGTEPCLGRTARKQRCRSPTVVCVWLRLSQRLRPIPVPMLTLMPTN